MSETHPFKHIVVADFEFEFSGHASSDDAKRSGERPRPICGVFKELHTGQTWRVWRDEFGPEPPFPCGPDTLFVAYYASAEIGCFLALGWKPPARILDLFTEFRNLTNGRPTVGGAGLVGALMHFGLDTIGAVSKDEMRMLALRGGPWTAAEQSSLTSYCEGDTLALERLLPVILPHIDLPRALLRGRYMAAAAAMEWNGTPIDVAALSELREHWLGIQDDLIAAIDADYGVYEGRSFRTHLWERWLIANSIPWPRLESGQLDLDDDAFRDMAKAFPEVSPIRELRSALSDLRLNDLAVGSDGYNRTILSAFRARTGRNQPSNTHFIFGPSVWLRGLIKPPPGHGIAYIDWEQQEFGIAAVLSGDQAKVAAYLSGDPYLDFAKRAGAAPPEATSKTHKPVRNQYKQCVLATQYGQGAEGLAARIDQPTIVARGLLRDYRETFRVFWRWSESIVDYAMSRGRIHTVFGWQLHMSCDPTRPQNPRSLLNYPMQANGSEMLRLACCLGVERGVKICAPVHDAVLIEAPLDRLDHDIAVMREAMAEASRAVLGGFELRTEVKEVRYPDRYMDEDRGRVMWDRVQELIAKRRTRAA
jgi:DNA polymerase-1